ncbi:MAG: hypothetical protein ACLFT5_10015, partial [Desulfovermiculus sp.]
MTVDDHVCSGKKAENRADSLKKLCQVQAWSYVKEYAGLDTSKTELLTEIHDHIQDKGVVEELERKRLLDQGYFESRQAVQEELNNLMRNDFLYYNPTLAQYKLQGRSME